MKSTMHIKNRTKCASRVRMKAKQSVGRSRSKQKCKNKTKCASRARMKAKQNVNRSRSK
jgi:hypothetical protein